MAEAGHLPSAVSLRLFDFANGRHRSDRAAVNTLMEAAKTDASAACALAGLPLEPDFRDSFPDYARSRAEALEFGSAQRHGACLAIAGASRFRYAIDPDGKVHRVLFDRSGFPLLLEAAKQGYYLAHVSLGRIREMELEIRGLDSASSLEIDRMLCWKRLAQQHTNWAGLDISLQHLRAGPWRPPRIPASALPLLDKYDPAKKPIQEKLVSPETCMDLEKQGDKP